MGNIIDPKLGIIVRNKTLKLILDAIRELKNDKNIKQDDYEQKITLIQYVLTKTGIEIKNSLGIIGNKKDDNKKMIQNIYSFCDECEWNRQEIDEKLEPFIELQKSIYRRNVEESTQKRPNINEFFYRYFTEYQDLLNAELDANQFLDIYFEVLGSGCSISETLQLLNVLNEEQKSELFHTIIKTAGLTLDSTPMDVYNVYKKTDLVTQSTIALRGKNTEIIEQLQTVRMDYESRLNAALEEYAKQNEIDQNKIPKGERKKLEGKVKTEFIAGWEENDRIIDGNYIYITELDVYIPLECVFDSKKVKKGIKLKGVTTRGFGENEKDFLEFCNALDMVVKQYDSKMMYGNIYQLLAEYRVDEKNVLFFKDRYEEKLNRSHLTKRLKRFAPIVLAALLGVAGGEIHGRLAASNTQIEAETNDEQESPSDESIPSDTESTLSDEKVAETLRDRMRVEQEKIRQQQEQQQQQEQPEEQAEEEVDK
ncbi:MAG TPA: hypothetical protein DEP51_01010 [Clostridiales bacterium]|nr:hypothetical protein [Clostridiales bacterium]